MKSETESAPAPTPAAEPSVEAAKPLTVEEALAELRQMFPSFEREITITDAPHYRRSKIMVRVHGQATTHPTLDDCMAIARRWKETIK